MARLARLAGLALVLSVATAALAQGGATTIYRDPNFRGPAVAVEQDNPNLGLRFQVFSIRVAGGESWELCPQANFRGRCLTVDRTVPDLRRAYGWPGPLQSMRRVGDDGWESGGGSGGGSGGTSPSLQGMASHYYPKPRTGRGGTEGQRVLACPQGSATANCARDNADIFCRNRGWTRAAHQLMETEGRQVYLADVLCVRAR